MAEFKYVMSEIGRYCDNHVCDTCEMKDVCSVVTMDAEPYKVAQLESMLEKWVEEHPLPQYPSWEDWLMSNGVVDLRDQISSLVARKLGVKPIG